MNKVRHIVFVAVCVFIIPLFTSCLLLGAFWDAMSLSDSTGVSSEQNAVSNNRTTSSSSTNNIEASSAQIETFDNGAKMMYSTKKLKTEDFYITNFFIKDIDYSGFNYKIFEMMKNFISEGTAQCEVLDEEHNEIAKSITTKGEFIYCGIHDEERRFIVDTIYDKKIKQFVEYKFILTISKDAYNKYRKVQNKCKSDIESSDKNIDLCNEIIKECSHATIQKSRTIQVPYTVTERYWVAGDIGRRTNSSLGSQPATPGHWETMEYTAYRNEVEYYTVPNPNYNPTAVANAKKNLQGWESVKNAAKVTLAKLTLPFVLEVYQPCAK